MAETTTEVKGFRNSALGKVLFKIAAIAGLQEALDSKADKAATYSNGNLVCFGTGGGMSDSGLSKNGLNDKLAKLNKLVTALPSLSSVNNGDECIYIGPTGNSLQFGQTYKATKNGVSVEYHINAEGEADDKDKWGTQEYTGYSSALQNIQYALETLGAETPYEWGYWDHADWEIDDDIVFTSDRYATEAAFKEAIEHDLNGLCTFSFNGSIAASEWTPKFALKSELPA